MRSIKDMVKDNQKVTFSYYRDGSLWYETECGFLFPVPIDDIGNATFLREDKAMLFMRYIRKYQESVKRLGETGLGVVDSGIHNLPPNCS